MAGFFITFGGVSKQVEVNTGILKDHIAQDMPISGNEHYGLKARVGQNEKDIFNIQKQLDFIIKTQGDNAEVLKDVRDYMRILRSQQRSGK
jgi:hypothetical protein